MNALLKIQSPTSASRIAHSVMAYDRLSDELVHELPIPLFLDTLALKVANVPPGDRYGAYSYALERRAADTFRFLLGLPVDFGKCEYFLEPTAGFLPPSSPQKLEAIKLMAEVTPYARYTRSEKPTVSERELVLPTLQLLAQRNAGHMQTSELVDRLTEIFAPSGKDAMLLQGRRDTHFSQKVRNLVSNRQQPYSFIRKGLALYEPQSKGLRITDKGRSTVRALTA